ncbi:MAG TPA: site-specific DNA-methyltransferase [Steroidobacteraceae bacterium]|nr:site-specific DNA-methyltransferase [Steroidobacteraceae bacterium]
MARCVRLTGAALLDRDAPAARPGGRAAAGEGAAGEAVAGEAAAGEAAAAAGEAEAAAGAAEPGAAAAGAAEPGEAFRRYARARRLAPLLLEGDARQVLRQLPCACVDCAMTSPPYWRKREYAQGGLGLEPDPRAYIGELAAILDEVKRVLKPQGSLWLNLGDSYLGKSLLGIPWRVALELTDRRGWLLRNDVIWHKIKSGMDNSTDRLGNVHEHVFHLVKQPRHYYYDADAVRSQPRDARIINGAVISATGVSGVRYRRQIELSTGLKEHEKRSALRALEQALADLAAARLSDFRMILRGQQRATHSASERVSGRARELREKGFYILKYHPKGSKPRDVWDIMPEDTQNRAAHFAPYPLDLCRIPILATCPPGGIVLDPFCGTGTTLAAAAEMGRRSVGVDRSREYLALAADRCAAIHPRPTSSG